jgi:putative peptidoglycan lipid II flippase
MNIHQWRRARLSQMNAGLTFVGERWRDRANATMNYKILSAVITVAFFTLLVKFLGMAKELVVAWRFGTGDHLDSFYIGYVVPELVINVVAGAFNTVLIPTYIRVREQEGKGAADKLFSSATVLSLGILSIATLGILGFAPLYLPHLASGFSPEKLDLTYKLLWTVSPLVLLTGLLTIWSAVLNAGERFALAAIVPMIFPLLTIAFLFMAPTLGVFGLTAGLVVGAILELILLGVALRRQRIPLMPRWYGYDQNLHQVIQQYLPMIAGSFLMCSTGIVDQAMAATLTSGSVSSLNYGNRITALPITLISTALGTAVIPYFSKMVANGQWRELRSTLNRAMQWITIATMPVALLLIVFSEPIVRVLFQRGSFTSSDVQLVAQIQIFFALQIPLRGPGSLVVQLISTARANHILMWGSAVNLIINIVLDYVFMKKFGVAGIALSTTFVYLFSTTYLWISAHYLIKKNLKLNSDLIS